MNCPNPDHKGKRLLKESNIKGYYECDKCEVILYIVNISHYPKKELIPNALS